MCQATKAIWHYWGSRVRYDLKVKLRIKVFSEDSTDVSCTGKKKIYMAILIFLCIKLYLSDPDPVILNKPHACSRNKKPSVDRLFYVAITTKLFYHIS